MARMTVNGQEWTFEITASSVVIRDSGGRQTSTPREKFHCFETVTTSDVKRFIMNGLKPVDYSTDERRARWQVKHGAFVGKNVTDPEHPEHAKLEAVKDQSQAIGDFLEWLGNDRPDGPIFLCERRRDVEIDNIWVPTGASAEKLLAEYFDIDTKKLEAEKRAILEAQRKANAKAVKA